MFQTGLIFIFSLLLFTTIIILPEIKVQITKTSNQFENLIYSVCVLLLIIMFKAT